MFHRFQERLGAAGLVVAVMALVLALGGAAIAANSNGDNAASASKKKNKKKKKNNAGLNGKQKKQVLGLIKKKGGGPAGPAGPAGPQGPAGANGAKGDTGATGATGVGTKGDTGDSIEVRAGAAGCGVPGGTTVQVEGQPGTAEEVCNGADGADGDDGTFDPNGFTQTGVINGSTPGLLGGPEMADGDSYLAPISFSIPLASAPDPIFVRGNPAGQGYLSTADCSGPGQAAAGKLCLYTPGGDSLLVGALTVTFVDPTDINGGAGTTEYGTVAKVECSGGFCPGAGLWAVTG